jgi:hypothetical protein
MNFPFFSAPKSKPACEHIRHISQVIKDPVNPKIGYIDTHYECSFAKKRISKPFCLNCTDYKPITIK